METKIKWMYDGHREAMREAIARTHAINARGNLRRDYAASLYLLTGMETVWPRIEKYAWWDDIDYEGMLNEPLSHGERLVVRLSRSLLKGSTRVDFTPIDLISDLDDDMFELAINGIILRRGRPTLEMLDETYDEHGTD